MKFGEKLRMSREKAGLSQQALATAIGLTSRTIMSYEHGTSHPKDRKVYFKLAEFFDVDVNYFLTEDEEFLSTVAKHYGKRGLDQANVILDQTAALFAGGELSEEDQAAFASAMQAIFLDSKNRAQKKFTPKKFRQPQPPPEG